LESSLFEEFSSYAHIRTYVLYNPNCINAHSICELLAIHGLVGVCDVQEEIFFMVLLIKRSHCGRGRRNHIVDEKEESVLRPEADSLPDEEVELPHGQVGGDQVLLFVQVTNSGLGRLLNDHGDSRILYC